jgi:hypothetical protein
MDDHTSKGSDLTWHRGEVAIQRSAGVAELMAPIAKQVIRGHLIEQHRTFFPKLDFIVAGAVDPQGDAWATILAGKPGFLDSPDPTRLRITATLGHTDPASAGMEDGDAVGLLGIELTTRRRNRLNGHIAKTDNGTFDVIVSQSYGNCPRYIRQRQSHFVRDPMDDTGEDAIELGSLDTRCLAMVANAETLFIASYVDYEDGNRHVDVSHKGGPPGFARVGRNGFLTIPDFAGNLYFNTLGNIVLNPKCGLAFVDFDTGDVLQITGNGEVILDAPEIATFQGAERLLRVRPRRIVLRPGALPLRWSSPSEGVP